MQFLSQNMLWGLLGLGIPILIHLLNKNNKNQIKWAATTFLIQNEAPKSRSYVPKDILLLLLRCIILGLISVVLAIPVLHIFSKTKKKVNVFEKTATIQSQFKFELENSSTEAYEFEMEIEPIQNKNVAWKEKRELTQKDIQSIVNQLNKRFGTEDSIHIFLRPSNDFYDMPILFLPENMQVSWAASDNKPKIPVWKANKNYFDKNGKVEKFDPENDIIVFEKDSLITAVNSKSVFEKAYTRSAIQAIKQSLGYPISIQNSNELSDLDIGESEISKQKNVQLGAFKNGIHNVTNMQNLETSPTNINHSDIRSGRYAEVILADIQRFIGLSTVVNKPNNAELELSIKKSNFNFQKSSSLDLHYVWFFIIFLICLERFLSVKHSK
jgi:Aerotolerance regulator N-terminal